ncbi:MAG: response regulator [Chloroflexi bacterium]|nr:response regulator [Chloroflexota bacterium]
MATIFVLEDDPDLLHLYTRALSFRGYEVEYTNSAESAIAMLNDGAVSPDIAVLDMSMPGLPGSAVVNFIRNESDFQDLPIIVVSCDEDFRELLRNARVRFMTKPIELAELYTAVAQLAS